MHQWRHVWFCVLCSMGLCAYAQPHSYIIEKVDVVGTQRIDKQCILDYFPAHKNHEYSKEDLDNFLKKLFDLGVFEDIQINVSQGTLHVHVKENRFLNQIVFEGNDDASDDELRTVIEVKPRQAFTATCIKEAEQKILDFYRSKGRYRTTVTAEMIQRPFNRVDLVFKIKEGPKAYVRSIFFIGNKKFTDSALSQIVSTREERWYRFFSPPEEIYSAERMRYDAELLRQFYLKNGYVDVQIVSYHAELSDSHKDFILTFNISEGKRYKFGHAKIRSEIDYKKTNFLFQKLDWEEGEWFNGHLLRDMCTQLGVLLNEKGISFVEVVPVTSVRGDFIDVEFVLQKSKPLFIEKITIKDNFGTDDTVIRRELSFAEGDPLCPGRISESQKKLEDMDFFETVDISDTPGSQPGLRQVNIKVKEKSTGNIQFGGGYSSIDGFVAKLGLMERNFLGKGYGVNFNTYISKRSFDVEAGTFIPYFMRRNVTVNAGAFFSRYRGDTRGTLSSDGGYRQQSIGLSFGATYALNKRLFQGWSYKIRQDRLRLASFGLSPYITRNIKGHEKQWLSIIGHDLLYDRLEKVASEPVAGYFAKLSNAWSGAGGNIHFLSNVISGGYFLPLNEDRSVLLKFEASYGCMLKLGYMRFKDQFFLGGFSFPGFSESGIGPRDRYTGDALGGRQYYTASAKLYFPLGLPKELAFKGILYAQSGSLWSSLFKENPSPWPPILQGPYIESAKFFNRVTVGGGVVFKLMFFGNMGLIFSKALAKHPRDTRETFLLLWGQDF